jgi:tetratricopeptide (TPR) repeat protein
VSAPAAPRTPAAPGPQPTRYSQDAEANDLFLRGQELLAHGDPRNGGSFGNAREAIRLYQQAIDRDPSLALAQVQIARAWIVQGYSNPDAPSGDEIEAHSRAAVKRALEIDPDLPEAHQLLAQMYYLTDYDWTAAEREYRWVISHDPNNAAAHAGLAAFLATMGRFDEALEQAALADGLRHSAADAFNRARILYSKRNFEAAVEDCRRALSQQENQAFRFFLGLMLVAQGHPQEAIAEFERAASQGNNAGAWLGLAYGYATVGRRDDALRVIETVRATHTEEQVVPYRLAAVHLALGDRAGAIRELEREYETHGSWIVQLKVDPVMDPLRDDPRFQALMRRMNFS